MSLVNKLVEFKNLTSNNRYKKDYVTVLEGRTYFYDITEYENEDSQIIYSVLERYINNKVQVINFIRDVREDHGDDGGYTFYVGIYKGRFILGSNNIDYNLDFSEDFKTIDGLESDDEDVEYKLFNSLSEINDFIEVMLNKVDALTKEHEGWDWVYSTYDMDPVDFDSQFMFMCIRNLGTAYSEDLEENKKNLLRITTDKYKPNLYDPIELLDSYVEEFEIEAVDLPD